jgi:hypothetical protein
MSYAERQKEGLNPTLPQDVVANPSQPPSSGGGQAYATGRISASETNTSLPPRPSHTHRYHPPHPFPTSLPQGGRGGRNAEKRWIALNSAE